MILSGDNIQVFLPNVMNECSVTQLEIIATAQLNKTPVDKFAFMWITAACDSETLKALLEEYEPDSLSDAAITATEAFLATKQPLTNTPYGLIYLENDKHLVGPEDNMANICMGQCIDAEEQFFLFLMNKNLKHLAKLTAILFRPPHQKKYNNSLNNSLAADVLKTLSETQLHVICEYYQGVRSLMAGNFKHAFPLPKATPDAKIKEKTAITGATILEMVLGYHAKLVQYSNNIPSQKQEQYHTNAWTVLEFIDTDIANYKRQEKQMETLKRKNGKS
jgi:hypothetical protein